MDTVILTIFSPTFLVFIFGVLLLWKVEGIKAQVERQSHFAKKWADYFFDTCNDFLKSVEHIMALLRQLQFLPNPNNERGIRYQQECNDYLPVLTELELRIRRMSCFAPRSGNGVKKKASVILGKLSNIINPLSAEIPGF